MNNLLNGKVALVTGGTKGIGKAIADKLTNLGAEVIVTARNVPENQDGYNFIAADLRLPDSASNIARQVLDNFGRIDIIVNNAGANTSPGGGYSTLEDENWNNDMQLNLMAAVRLNRALLPTMIAQQSGTIINISTYAAIEPHWEMTMSYSTSKAALNAYSKALAKELGSKGIRVNVVSPGVVKTTSMLAFIEKIATSSNIPYDIVLQSMMEKAGISLGKMAEEEDIANLVGFLASSEAQYITGSNYIIDGGMSSAI